MFHTPKDFFTKRKVILLVELFCYVNLTKEKTNTLTSIKKKRKYTLFITDCLVENEYNYGTYLLCKASSTFSV